jgi:hypothetical protein
MHVAGIVDLGLFCPRGEMTDAESVSAIRALNVTKDTIVFVDRNQVNAKMLTESTLIPDCVIVTTNGPPNVEAMTREELAAILGHMK